MTGETGKASLLRTPSRGNEEKERDRHYCCEVAQEASDEKNAEEEGGG